MFKYSKKNEGLSGAAVFSDSVIMPLKILIVLAMSIEQRLPTSPLSYPVAIMGWEGLPRVQWGCLLPSS